MFDIQSRSPPYPYHTRVRPIRHNRPVQRRRKPMRLLIYLLLGLCWLGCAGATSGTNQLTSEDVVTVEGQVTVRGNTPFTAIMLETDQRNLYVLVLGEAERRALQHTLPARFRITGAVYADDWNGRTYAHLRPIVLERL